MKVTGTYQINTNVYPCPPLPVLHTPARKMKSDPKHRDWRVNPMARMTTTQHQYHNRASNTNTSSSPSTSPPHSSDKVCDIPLPSTSACHYKHKLPLPSTSSYHYQQITPRFTLEKQKFDGVRQSQYANMNTKFANLTMALNTAYQKTQEKAEKRSRKENNLKETPEQVMSY